MSKPNNEHLFKDMTKNQWISGSLVYLVTSNTKVKLKIN